MSDNVNNSWQKVIKLTWNQILKFVNRNAKFTGEKKKKLIWSRRYKERETEYFYVALHCKALFSCMKSGVI